VKATYVAYRSPGAVITDVLSGQIQAGVPTFIPAVQSVTALAVTGERRLEFQPSVPTIRESGYDVAAITWIALLAPAGLPDKIRDQLNAAVNDYLKSDDGRQAFAKINVRARGRHAGRACRDHQEGSRAVGADHRAREYSSRCQLGTDGTRRDDRVYDGHSNARRPDGHLRLPS